MIREQLHSGIVVEEEEAREALQVAIRNQSALQQTKVRYKELLYFFPFFIPLLSAGWSKKLTENRVCDNGEWLRAIYYFT